jgi:aryl-alcohol dehydrogenase-like predicted oxidoreductase
VSDKATAAAAGTFDVGGELTVNRMGFGAMRLCGDDILGETGDVEEARRVLNRLQELNVDFVDTADAYGPGTSERLIREELHPYEAVLVATKGGNMRRPDGEWVTDGTSDYLQNACLCSLDRLGVDSIDLYQHHRPDPDVDYEETVETLAFLKDEGFVEHVGLSNVDVEQLELAGEHVEVATVQYRYNVTEREDEAVLQACEECDIGYVPWGPVAWGGLDEPAIRETAERHDATAYQVALAFLLEHSPVTLPIPGTSSVDHLEENVAAAGLDLDGEDLARLRDVDPRPGH